MKYRAIIVCVFTAVVTRELERRADAGRWQGGKYDTVNVAEQ